MKTKYAITIALALAIVPAGAWAADYPFVGKWNCGISNFTFTAKTYNDGYSTDRILKVEKATQRQFKSDKGASSYRLDFSKGYAI